MARFEKKTKTSVRFDASLTLDSGDRVQVIVTSKGTPTTVLDETIAGNRKTKGRLVFIGEEKEK